MSLSRKQTDAKSNHYPDKINLSVLKDGMLLDKTELERIKKLNLPYGRHHRREINAMLGKDSDWTCPYSIIRGYGIGGGGDVYYAVYRDNICDKPVLAGLGSTAKVKYIQDQTTGAWPVVKTISAFKAYAELKQGKRDNLKDEISILQKTYKNELDISQMIGRADPVVIEKKSEKTGLIKYGIVLLRGKGYELFELVKAQQLPKNATKLKKIALNILQKLMQMHEQGVLLRDLKLENIMVDPKTCDVMLIDTGLAVKLDPKTRIGNDGISCGSLETIAPEIYYNHKCISLDYTEQTDIYAAGRVLQALLLGICIRPVDDELVRVDLSVEIIQKGRCLTYVVEDDIAKLIVEMLNDEPKKRPTLAEACMRLSKCIPTKKPAVATPGFFSKIDFRSLSAENLSKIPPGYGR